MDNAKIGTSVQMSDGSIATCVAYNGCCDFDIEFEDGFVVHSKSWSDFLSGKTVGEHKRWLLQKEVVGLTVTMTNGLKATVVEYENSSSITIRWETGELQKIKSLAHFREGKIAVASNNNEAKAKRRLHEVRTMNCGLTLKIVEYFGAHNITVECENGRRLYKKYYTDFVNGTISYPRDDDWLAKKVSESMGERVGTTIKMKNGLCATCVDWKSDNSFHIKFEDGFVVYVIKWDDFINGTAIQKYETNKKMQMTGIAKNGQKMWIKQYNGWDDVTVQFDDGTVVEHQRFEKFKNGDVVNPNLRIKAHTSMNEYFIQHILAPYGFAKAKQGSLTHLGLGRMELDCFNEKKMIAIEYDGEVHRFRPNTDLKKNIACENAGIRLIRIREGKLGVLNSISIDFVVKNQAPLNDELQDTMRKVICLINDLGDMHIDPNVSKIKDRDELYDQFNK